ncbi:MAG: PaaI family thioesterase [Deltaproteobacteria bacterium]|nr:PaaI family thioesterase [Deltaproteobacteria bacterium]
MKVGTTDHCFVCGRHNPDGLRLDFDWDAEARTIETSWHASPVYQGYDGILHGGILSTLLDECVGKLSVHLGTPAVTAEMNVRFLKPVPTDKVVRFRGRMVGERGRVLFGEAEALLEDGTVAASATFTLVKGKT